MSEFKQIVNVIPLTRVNLGSSQIFTYLVPSKLRDRIRPGQLVRVPFGKRYILGVTSSFEMPRFAAETQNLRFVNELVMPSQVMNEKSFTLANWLAKYYISSLGLVIKTMLPKMAVNSKKPQLVGYEKYNPDYVLTESQRQAVTQIVNALGKPATFLLYGVTGSGKTEVYMQVIGRLMQHGQQVIVLVPEISLTEMAIQRFAKRFGIEKIALLHSRLRDSERLWMWQQIRSGEKQIIIGPRSAIFAPISNLGLIILDEEHDPSFKQFDQNPKYHARTVAKKLSELYRCPLILGDATPALETFFEALQGKITLLRLPHRIKADVGLPKVKVIDMRVERGAGNFSVFSEFLKLEILNNLKEKKQIILFLNRRGTSTFILCPDCGFLATCKECSVNLVWHSALKKLLCHHCGKSYVLPASCPNCRGTRIRYFGIGTQLVEEELKKLLRIKIQRVPPVIARMDSDTIKRRGESEKIYQDWQSGKIQILIGTQITSKGWDVSRVGLVGIISADTSLNLPDFRSNERTFQLLTQVAGRAGRGSDLGLVILQTYNSENYAIGAAASHDFLRFYRTEIQERRRLNYPPFFKLVRLTFKHSREEIAQKKANNVFRELASYPQKAYDIFGPIPAFISKRSGKYQYQIILKFPLGTENNHYEIFKNLPSDVDIDVEPESLL